VAVVGRQPVAVAQIPVAVAVVGHQPVARRDFLEREAP